MSGIDRWAVVAVLLACCGCAVRQPALTTWRLVPHDAGRILVPPDVTSPEIAQRTFRTDAVTGPGACASQAGGIAIERRGRRTLVTVMRDSLEKQPAGWLGEWASELEARSCVRPGDGMKLAARVAESVPLEPAAAMRLLYADDRQTGTVEVGPHTRFRVVSPILRDPKLGLMAEGPTSVTGNGNSLTITAKSTDNLLGYETALYAVEPKPGAAGYTIVPRSAERHIDAEIERRPQPETNYFQFPPGAAFYRVFYKAEDNDFTALIVAAPTPAELDRRAEALQASGSAVTCEEAATQMCVAIPRDAGLTTLTAVTVNGAEVLVHRGGSVLQAIRAAGEPEPERVLPGLVVHKPWNGRLIRVDFDRSDAAILRLVVAGGERISWR